MQKRRGGNHVLPVTESDARSPKTASNRGKRRKSSIPLSAVWGVAKFFLAIVGVGLMVVLIQRNLSLRGRKTEEPTETGSVLQEERANMTFDDFESPHLLYAFQKSKLVALYFAASWCPMSTPVTKMLDEDFRDVLVKPPDDNNSTESLERHGLSLVYVSSDLDAEQMEEYVKPNWMTIPFESTERAKLKRHFLTCARRELEELGIDRKREIPTLIVLGAESGQVLTYDGVQDVRDEGAEAVDHWLALERLSNSLQSKFQPNKW